MPERLAKQVDYLEARGPQGLRRRRVLDPQAGRGHRNEPAEAAPPEFSRDEGLVSLEQFSQSDLDHGAGRCAEASPLRRELRAVPGL